jgi:nucleoside-diphosphate-sugar epimerase
MKRVAILGANGQVGAEVCLILRNHPEIKLVPICRNRFGSAFLRYQGIACRHGLPAEAEQAAALRGDCDVVVNFALGVGTLRQARDTNERLIKNSIAFSPPMAKIIYFSTTAVYGGVHQGARIRWRSAYAREKLRCERA